eukprot:gene6634-4753_t
MKSLTAVVERKEESQQRATKGRDEPNERLPADPKGWLACLCDSECHQLHSYLLRYTAWRSDGTVVPCCCLIPGGSERFQRGLNAIELFSFGPLFLSCLSNRLLGFPPDPAAVTTDFQGVRYLIRRMKKKKYVH